MCNNTHYCDFKCRGDKMYKRSYCIPKCKYYSECQGNINICIVRLFHQVLSTLTSREMDILRWRYGFVDGKSYPRTKIAEKYSLSVERIKEIELKALRKLRHPKRGRILRQATKLLSLNTTTSYAKLYKAVFGTNEIDDESYNFTIPLLLASAKTSLTINLDEIEIINCDFSIRTAGCLSHNGIKTIGELSRLDFTSLQKIRNLGKKSIIEIYLTLDAMGKRFIDCSRDKYPQIIDYLTEVLMFDNNLVVYVQEQLKDKSVFREIAKKIFSTFGIETVNDLSQLTRQDLYNNAFSDSEIEKVVEFLNSYGFNLAWEATYCCSDCGESFVEKWDFEEKHFCKNCLDRHKRKNSVSSIKVNLTTYESTTFTEKGMGVTLHAHITNATNDIRKINLIDFYIIKKADVFDLDEDSPAFDIQISPSFNHDGYCFDQAILFPQVTKCCGKIFLFTKEFLYLCNNYVIITLESDGTEYMFKFDYCRDSWELQDYYEIKGKNQKA